MGEQLRHVDREKSCQVQNENLIEQCLDLLVNSQRLLNHIKGVIKLVGGFFFGGGLAEVCRIYWSWERQASEKTV